MAATPLLSSLARQYYNLLRFLSFSFPPCLSLRIVRALLYHILPSSALATNLSSTAYIESLSVRVLVYWMSAIYTSQSFWRLGCNVHAEFPQSLKRTSKTKQANHSIPCSENITEGREINESRT